MYQKVVLPNGIRIVTEEIDHVRSVSIGLWVGTGSRNETKGYEGISHFIEHMFFKGTKNRTARQLAESLEAVGGQINAFTTKELTCYYAKVLDENLDLAVDVLQDMFFNSLFDEAEINKEKNVVLEEIKMYQDSPDELIHDLFSQNIWNDHPLGKPILGAEETIRDFNSSKIRQYLDTKYTPDQVVIAVAGNIDHDDVVEKLTPFGAFHRQREKTVGEVPAGSTIRKAIGRETEQMHVMVGVPGLAQEDDDIYAMHIINNILGGSLSSRLFQEIREQRGLAYSVFSYHSTFADTGLFSIYAGTSPEKTEEVVETVLQEVNCMRKEGISEEDLNRTKAQIKGNLLLGLESVGSRMSRLGKTELSFGRVKTAEEAVEKLEKVKLDDIIRVMNRLWLQDKISVLSLGKEGTQTNYEDIVNRIDWK